MDIWADICKCRVLYPSSLNVRVNTMRHFLNFSKLRKIGHLTFEKKEHLENEVFFLFSPT